MGEGARRQRRVGRGERERGARARRLLLFARRLQEPILEWSIEAAESRGRESARGYARTVARSCFQSEEINLDNLGEKGWCSTRKGDALFHADDIIIAAG